VETNLKPIELKDHWRRYEDDGEEGSLPPTTSCSVVSESRVPQLDTSAVLRLGSRLQCDPIAEAS
jgi:hypothetical protein